jgi:Fic family protein
MATAASAASSSPSCCAGRECCTARSFTCLSHYLKAHRAEYYDRIQAVRTDGNWEGWLKFFLRGVADVAQQAASTARAILDLREAHRRLIASKGGGSAAGMLLLDYLFEQPLTTVRLVEQRLGCAYVTANNLAEQFVDWGILDETTGQQRYRRFRYSPYLALFGALPRRGPDR